MEFEPLPAVRERLTDIHTYLYRVAVGPQPPIAPSQLRIEELQQILQPLLPPQHVLTGLLEQFRHVPSAVFAYS